MEKTARTDSNHTHPDLEVGREALYGLLGYPLGHSFSRTYFNNKFAQEGINAEYVNFELPAIEQLPQVLATHPQLQGFNVTIPYKQAVIAYLDDITPEAREIGAVNVVRVTRQGQDVHLNGYNSDIIGFCDSLRPMLKASHRQALVLGTGGASKAVCCGLEQLGIGWTYVSRHATSGQLTYADLTDEVMHSHTLIVNCTPLGMFPNVGTCPDIPYNRLTPDHLLYDLVYNPEPTLFMQRGAAQGATTKGGLEMLHRQAEASWQFWHGKD